MASTLHRSLAGKSTLFLLCVCLLFAACSTQGTNTQAPKAPTGFHTTVKTADQQFLIQFSVTPNRLGLNTFSMKVDQAGTGQPATNLIARLDTVMLDMDMGADQVNVPSSGSGQYSTQGRLSMAGHWAISILLRTPDSKLHQTTVKLSVSP